MTIKYSSSAEQPKALRVPHAKCEEEASGAPPHQVAEEQLEQPPTAPPRQEPSPIEVVLEAAGTDADTDPIAQVFSFLVDSSLISPSCFSNDHMHKALMRDRGGVVNKLMTEVNRIPTDDSRVYVNTDGMTVTPVSAEDRGARSYAIEITWDRVSGALAEFTSLTLEELRRLRGAANESNVPIGVSVSVGDSDKDMRHSIVLSVEPDGTALLIDCEGKIAACFEEALSARCTQAGIHLLPQSVWLADYRSHINQTGRYADLVSVPDSWHCVVLSWMAFCLHRNFPSRFGNPLDALQYMDSFPRDVFATHLHESYRRIFCIQDVAAQKDARVDSDPDRELKQHHLNGMMNSGSSAGARTPSSKVGNPKDASTAVSCTPISRVTQRLTSAESSRVQGKLFGHSKKRRRKRQKTQRIPDSSSSDSPDDMSGLSDPEDDTKREARDRLATRGPAKKPRRSRSTPDGYQASNAFDISERVTSPKPCDARKKKPVEPSVLRPTSDVYAFSASSGSEDDQADPVARTDRKEPPEEGDPYDFSASSESEDDLKMEAGEGAPSEDERKELETLLNTTFIRRKSRFEHNPDETVDYLQVLNANGIRTVDQLRDQRERWQDADITTALAGLVRGNYTTPPWHSVIPTWFKEQLATELRKHERAIPRMPMPPTPVPSAPTTSVPSPVDPPPPAVSPGPREPAQRSLLIGGSQSSPSSSSSSSSSSSGARKPVPAKHRPSSPRKRRPDMAGSDSPEGGKHRAIPVGSTVSVYTGEQGSDLFFLGRIIAPTARFVGYVDVRWYERRDQMAPIVGPYRLMPLSKEGATSTIRRDAILTDGMELSDAGTLALGDVDLIREIVLDDVTSVDEATPPGYEVVASLGAAGITQDSKIACIADLLDSSDMLLHKSACIGWGVARVVKGTAAPSPSDGGVVVALEYPPGGNASVKGEWQRFPAVTLNRDGYLGRDVRGWALLKAKELGADALTEKLVARLAKLVSAKLQEHNQTHLQGLHLRDADLIVSSRRLASFIRKAAADTNGREGGVLGAHDPAGFVDALIKFCNSKWCVAPDFSVPSFVGVLRKVNPSQLLGGMPKSTKKSAALYKPWVIYPTHSSIYEKFVNAYVWRAREDTLPARFQGGAASPYVKAEVLKAANSAWTEHKSLAPAARDLEFNAVTLDLPSLALPEKQKKIKFGRAKDRGPWGPKLEPLQQPAQEDARDGPSGDIDGHSVINKLMLACSGHEPGEKDDGVCSSCDKHRTTQANTKAATDKAAAAESKAVIDAYSPEYLKPKPDTSTQWSTDINRVVDAVESVVTDESTRKLVGQMIQQAVDDGVDIHGLDPVAAALRVRANGYKTSRVTAASLTFATTMAAPSHIKAIGLLVRETAEACVAIHNLGFWGRLGQYLREAKRTSRKTKLRTQLCKSLALALGFLCNAFEALGGDTLLTLNAEAKLKEQDAAAQQAAVKTHLASVSASAAAASSLLAQLQSTAPQLKKACREALKRADSSDIKAVSSLDDDFGPFKHFGLRPDSQLTMCQRPDWSWPIAKDNFRQAQSALMQAPLTTDMVVTTAQFLHDEGTLRASQLVSLLVGGGHLPETAAATAAQKAGIQRALLRKLLGCFPVFQVGTSDLSNDALNDVVLIDIHNPTAMLETVTLLLVEDGDAQLQGGRRHAQGDVVDQREEDDEGEVDLRNGSGLKHAGGRPRKADQFPQLVSEMMRYVNGAGAQKAQGRRRDAIARTSVTISALRKHLLKSVPGLKKLALSTVRAMALPSHAGRRQADRHHNLVPFLLDRNRVDNSRRGRSTNAHYCLAKVKMLRESFGAFAGESFVVSMDDMAKLDVGIPATSQYHRLNALISPSKLPQFLDHSFPVGSMYKVTPCGAVYMLEPEVMALSTNFLSELDNVATAAGAAGTLEDGAYQCEHAAGGGDDHDHSLCEDKTFAHAVEMDDRDYDRDSKLAPQDGVVSDDDDEKGRTLQPSTHHDKHGRLHVSIGGRSRGGGVVTLRPAKFVNVDMSHHAHDLSIGLDKSGFLEAGGSGPATQARKSGVVIVDGATDLRTCTEHNIVFLFRVWVKHSLEYLAVCRNAANYSAYNPVERLWSPASKKLAGVTVSAKLPGDDKPPSELGADVDATTVRAKELDVFHNAANEFKEIWTNMDAPLRWGSPVHVIVPDKGTAGDSQFGEMSPVHAALTRAPTLLFKEVKDSPAEEAKRQGQLLVLEELRQALKHVSRSEHVTLFSPCADASCSYEQCLRVQSGNAVSKGLHEFFTHPDVRRNPPLVLPSKTLPGHYRTFVEGYGHVLKEILYGRGVNTRTASEKGESERNLASHPDRHLPSRRKQFEDKKHSLFPGKCEYQDKPCSQHYTLMSGTGGKRHAMLLHPEERKRKMRERRGKRGTTSRPSSRSGKTKAKPTTCAGCGRSFKSRSMCKNHRRDDKCHPKRLSKRQVRGIQKAAVVEEALLGKHKEVDDALVSEQEAMHINDQLSLSDDLDAEDEDSDDDDRAIDYYGYSERSPAALLKSRKVSGNEWEYLVHWCGEDEGDATWHTLSEVDVDASMLAAFNDRTSSNSPMSSLRSRSSRRNRQSTMEEALTQSSPARGRSSGSRRPRSEDGKEISLERIHDDLRHFFLDKKDATDALKSLDFERPGMLTDPVINAVQYVFEREQAAGSVAPGTVHVDGFQDVQRGQVYTQDAYQNRWTRFGFGNRGSQITNAVSSKHWLLIDQPGVDERRALAQSFGGSDVISGVAIDSWRKGDLNHRSLLHVKRDSMCLLSGPTRGRNVDEIAVSYPECVQQAPMSLKCGGWALARMWGRLYGGMSIQQVCNARFDEDQLYETIWKMLQTAAIHPFTYTPTAEFKGVTLANTATLKRSAVLAAVAEAHGKGASWVSGKRKSGQSAHKRKRTKDSGAKEWLPSGEQTDDRSTSTVAGASRRAAAKKRKVGGGVSRPRQLSDNEALVDLLATTFIRRKDKYRDNPDDTAKYLEALGKQGIHTVGQLRAQQDAWQSADVSAMFAGIVTGAPRALPWHSCIPSWFKRQLTRELKKHTGNGAPSMKRALSEPVVQPRVKPVGRTAGSRGTRQLIKASVIQKAASSSVQAAAGPRSVLKSPGSTKRSRGNVMFTPETRKTDGGKGAGKRRRLDMQVPVIQGVQALTHVYTANDEAAKVDDVHKSAPTTPGELICTYAGADAKEPFYLGKTTSGVDSDGFINVHWYAIDRATSTYGPIPLSNPEAQGSVHEDNILVAGITLESGRIAVADARICREVVRGGTTAEDALPLGMSAVPTDRFISGAKGDGARLALLKKGARVMVKFAMTGWAEGQLQSLPTRKKKRRLKLAVVYPGSGVFESTVRMDQYTTADNAAPDSWCILE
jgi:hypothetical protein